MTRSVDPPAPTSLEDLCEIFHVRNMKSKRGSDGVNDETAACIIVDPRVLCLIDTPDLG